MIDLAEVMRLKKRKDAQTRLSLLQLINSRHLEKGDYRELVQGLLRDAGVSDVNAKFDRGKMDALHAFTAAHKR